jgi:hypothetical protein
MSAAPPSPRVLLDETFHAHGELTFPTDLASPDATMRGIVHAIEQTLAAAGRAATQLCAIGLGVPGQNDPKPASCAWPSTCTGRTSR